MLRILATATTLLVASVAHANATASHYLWDSGTLPSSGQQFYTFRLILDVTDCGGQPGYPDDWMAAGLEVDLTGGVFYQDVLGGDPPDPDLFPSYPDLEYDSYYTSPSDYPNTDYDGTITRFAEQFDTDTRLETTWFDTIDTGNGTFVLAQITVLPSSPGWCASGVLEYAIYSTVMLFSYEFELTPEPGTLLLLAIGGLAAVRRRG